MLIMRKLPKDLRYILYSIVVFSLSLVSLLEDILFYLLMFVFSILFFGGWTILYGLL